MTAAAVITMIAAAAEISKCRYKIAVAGVTVASIAAAEDTILW